MQRETLSNEVLSSKLDDLKEDFSDLKTQFSGISEHYYKFAVLTEKIEKILSNNELNDNKGLIGRVNELTRDVDELKIHKAIIVEENLKRDKRYTWQIALVGLILVVIQIATSFKH